VSLIADASTMGLQLMHAHNVKTASSEHQRVNAPPLIQSFIQSLEFPAV